MSGVPQLPNPLTPLAWLPPDTAFQLEIVRYILVGSLAVSIVVQLLCVLRFFLISFLAGMAMGCSDVDVRRVSHVF